MRSRKPLNRHSGQTYPAASRDGTSVFSQSVPAVSTFWIPKCNFFECNWCPKCQNVSRRRFAAAENDLNKAFAPIIYCTKLFSLLFFLLARAARRNFHFIPGIFLLKRSQNEDRGVWKFKKLVNFQSVWFWRGLASIIIPEKNTGANTAVVLVPVKKRCYIHWFLYIHWSPNPLNFRAPSARTIPYEKHW